MAPNYHDLNGTTVDDSNPSRFVCFVNGVLVEDDALQPEWTLLSYLRKKLRLCGTKLGCGEGGCGACTVMVSFYDAPNEVIKHISVNACLAPIASVYGMAVTTIEGIGSTRGKLHAVQERMANAHGSQCGFCTPGIVMSMYTLLRNKPKPEMADIETYFQGNLCRCTGYRPILEGFETFTDSWAQTTSSGSNSNGGCSGPKNGVCCQQGTDSFGEESSSPLFDAAKFKLYDPTQEIIFPPYLKLHHEELFNRSLTFQSPEMSWFRPNSLKALLKLKDQFPDAKIVNGNTELGVEMKFKNCKYPVMIQPSHVSELTNITMDVNSIKIGAAVTLSAMEDFFLKVMCERPKHETQILFQMVEMLRWFAGKQIRNVSAIGGNVMTGSPISDLNQILMAAGAKLELASQSGSTRIVTMDQHFFTGYRKNVVEPTELLVSISLPFLAANQYFTAYKQARRRDDDIAIVNSAFFFDLDPKERTINEARMAFGGMAPTTTMPLRSMDLCRGMPWDKTTIEKISDQLLEDLPLPPGVPGAMVRFRRSLTLSFLMKAFLEISQSSGYAPIDPREVSAIDRFHAKPIKGHQFFEISQNGSEITNPVGNPLKHKSADKQATGEAIYVDDMPYSENECYISFVLSTKAHANILMIDSSKAQNVPGYLDFFTVKDILPERNEYGVAIRRDEVLFAVNKVETIGQVIGIIAAETQEAAQKAAKLVRVDYEELKPIVTIEEAIAANSFHPWANNTIAKGDVEVAFKECDHVLEGQMRTGAQEHFYLETQACIAVPIGEDGEMHLYSSSQNPTETQECVAEALGVDMNKVVCHVRRLGGGFGGKETRCVPIALGCAFVAQKMRRPTRVMLDRDEDMVMSGHRHPFLAKYKVGFNNDGTIKALDLDLYNNAGYTMDLSFSVMERAMFHSDNSYRIENVHIRGHVCKTNVQSNTAFRGFGGPQGMMIVENWMDQMAVKLKMDPVQLRFKNLYAERDVTYFNTILQHCTLQRCWQECQEKSHFQEQRQEVDHFNQANRWKKQGIYMVPVKFGIAFASPHMNQGGALVQIYRDGSVLITHGGTEMGQGLHTKMIQVASQVFQIAHDKIHLSETSTDKVPNTSPTAASVGSDINGMAIFNACHTLLKRLDGIKKKNPSGSWDDWIKAAYFERISLSAVGFYATPDLGYNFQTNTGKPFHYYTYGVGCSRVEIDCLTGDHNVLRTDIVMDLGESMNPAIDIGQIEGAFVQGYGLFVMEQLIHSADGNLLTRGPGAYKIPGFGDIPKEFNVSLLRGAPNPRAVFSSKAVGEPPLFLASSVFFAIKEAVRAARLENQIENAHDFDLPAPVTSERIRMACEDNITSKVPKLPPQGTFKPWGIQVGCEQALSSLRLMLSHPFGLPGGGCFEANVIIRLHSELALTREDSVATHFLLGFCESFMRICSALSKKSLDELWVHPKMGHLWLGPKEQHCVCFQMKNATNDPDCIPLIAYKSDHSSWNKGEPSTPIPCIRTLFKADSCDATARDPTEEISVRRSALPQLIDTWLDKKLMLNTSLEVAENLASIGLVIQT
eukprot:TCALIF_12703-PA protein Name:"Similar to XDH Xanthine dehydrogenase/oxidase (Gallus gallus)" AED:0.07 eAED:0.07 QI:278/0.8/0.66/1/1/1/6/364/1546